MSVLRYSDTKSRHFVEARQNDQLVHYRLTSEGIRYLVVELGVDDDEPFGPEVLSRLLEKGWALPEGADEPKPAPAPAPPKPPQTLVPEPKVASQPPAPAASHKPHVSENEGSRAQSRTRGRMVALQVLYQIEQNTGIDPREIERFVDRRIRDTAVRLFTRALIEGVRSDKTRIDALISDVAENWRLDRMAAIDRNILRIGAFELLSSDVPAKVAINEALELAKRYSTAQSSRFVNGILDRLLNAEAEPASPSEEAKTELTGESSHTTEEPADQTGS